MYEHCLYEGDAAPMMITYDNRSAVADASMIISYLLTFNRNFIKIFTRHRQGHRYCGM